MASPSIVRELVTWGNPRRHSLQIDSPLSSFICSLREDSNSARRLGFIISLGRPTYSDPQKHVNSCCPKRTFSSDTQKQGLTYHSSSAHQRPQGTMTAPLPKRIIKETERLQSEPVPGISAQPHDDNARYFDVMVQGPDGSCYEGWPVFRSIVVSS